ncbi:MAG: sugar ABC transporter substrate-binding protein [Oscillospiraceae bacterium]|nr:sugar ABC transporter substrate-binding protein [Oscillospiraceae bacterium]
MLKKQFLSFLVTVILIGSIFSGCGTGSDTPNSPAAENQESSSTEAETPIASSMEPIILRMWGGVPPESGPQATIDLFNETFADRGIQAEYERFVNDDTGNLKLETSLMAGNDVDLYMSYGISQLQQRASGNMALDLTDLIARDGFDMFGTFSSMAEAYYIDGRPYSLPTKLDQYGIVLNKTMFDAAGIPIPSSWTVDEFREVAKQLTHGEGQDKVYGMFWNSQQEIGYVFGYISVQTLGGSPFYKAGGLEANINDPVNIRAVSLVNDMMNVDGSSPTHTDSVTQKLSQEAMFLTGKSAMTIGPWMVRSIKDKEQFPHDFETAFAPYPTAGDKNFTQGGYGDHLCLNPKSQNIDAAWELAKWYAQEGMLPVVAGGRVPSANTYNPDDVVSAFLSGAEDHIDAESAKNILIIPATNYAVPAYSNKLPEIDKKVNEELEAIFTGQKTVEEALNAANDFANQQLAG